MHFPAEMFAAQQGLVERARRRAVQDPRDLRKHAPHGEALEREDNPCTALLLNPVEYRQIPVQQRSIQHEAGRRQLLPRNL